MTRLNITPGPWQAVCRSLGYVEGQEWGEDEYLQWEVHGPRRPRGRGDYFQADAYLITAAPELYEALEVLFDEANNFSVSGVYFNEECMGHRGLALARVALAKARGE